MVAEVLVAEEDVETHEFEDQVEPAAPVEEAGPGAPEEVPLRPLSDGATSAPGSSSGRPAGAQIALDEGADNAEASAAHRMGRLPSADNREVLSGADALRRAALEGPNITDEIAALRQERLQRRKEMNDASKRLRQDLSSLSTWNTSCQPLHGHHVFHVPALFSMMYLPNSNGGRVLVLSFVGSRNAAKGRG